MNAIYFDMDGTLADFYGVENYVDYLEKESTFPYRTAKPLFNMQVLARRLHQLQNKGYVIGIISWTANDSTNNYRKKVIKEKIKWLNKHLPSVIWDELIFCDYGKNKHEVATYNDGILFDDNEKIRKEWTGTAYDVTNILEVLKGLI